MPIGDDVTPEAAFEQIDALVSGAGFVPNAVSARIRAYQTALDSPGPLCRHIASRLLTIPGAHVALFTGFVVPGAYPRGENDGPLGTVALARALAQAGWRPTIHVDPELLETTRWLLAELRVSLPVLALSDKSRVRLDDVDIAIAIEKPGANRVGVMHTFDGNRIEGGSKPVDRLFNELCGAEKITIGIGDLGNEVGFGTLRETVERLNPRARTCSCGCGGGIASATVTEYLLPAAVSNWGAYGLTAALALLVGGSEIPLRPEEEARMLRVAAVRGCCDGVRRHAGYGIDGHEGEISVRLVAELYELVRRCLDGEKSAPVRDPIERGNEALRE